MNRFRAAALAALFVFGLAAPSFAQPTAPSGAAVAHVASQTSTDGAIRRAGSAPYQVAMNRIQTLSGMNPQSAWMNMQERWARIGLGALIADLLQSTQGWYSNLSIVPTSGLYVAVQPGSSNTVGSVYQYLPEETTAFGGYPSGTGPNALPADATAVYLQGQLFAATSNIGPLNPPGTSGQSIDYLIECQVQILDTTLQNVTIVSSNGTITQTTGNRDRDDIATCQSKAGSSATTGTQTAPSTDSGWVAVGVVAVAYGTTTISSGMISNSGYPPGPPTFGGTVHPAIPKGRLTLTSGTPFPSTTVSGASTIYYANVGSDVPIYNPNTSSWTNVLFSQLSLTLSATYQTSGSLYDVYVFSNSGTPTLCASPAWSSTTSRGSTDAIVQVNGIWLNNVSFAGTCYNGSTGYTVAAEAGTFLGTFLATANGQTTQNVGTQYANAASGGSVAYMGVYNAYNQVWTSVWVVDETTSWSSPCTAPSYCMLDGSANNRVVYVDGLGTSPVKSTLYIGVNNASGQNSYWFTLRDITSGSFPGSGPVGFAFGIDQANDGNQRTMSSRGDFNAALGEHFIQAFQSTTSSLSGFGGGSPLIVELPI